MEIVPVALFAYNRPDHLRRTLDCLCANQVRLIYAFVDGPRTPSAAASVAEVRRILRAVDWCELILAERSENLGLGRSIRAGVSSVLEKHPAVIVSEDDLICVPGTYAYLSAALEYYRDDSRVMSVTGWTHPRVTPTGVEQTPYFDGRAECWVWGTWARAWRGMDLDALTIIRQCRRSGIDVYRYGADLLAMAQSEGSQNTWAVRWLYHHILHGGLCLRPPYSLVEHIGFDQLATNFAVDGGWSNPPLQPCPTLPAIWPPAVENPQCATIWQLAMGYRPTQTRRAINLFHTAMDTLARKMRGRRIRHFMRMLVPPIFFSAAGWIRARLRPSKPEWEYIGANWPGDQAGLPGQGWAAPSILDTYKAKWPAFVRELAGTGPIRASAEAPNSRQEDVIFHNTMMIYAFSLALAARHKSSISMLDWGGGMGHFYLISQALVPNLEIDYSCKDLPGLAEYGQTLFPKAHFYTDTTCLDRQYDFVLASSSLQYVPDWADLFNRLARACSGYMLVTRLPITHAAASYVFVQRPYQYGYQTEYPAWCLNRTEFLGQAASAGVQLVREFSVGFTCDVHNAPEPSEYRGFLFRAAAR